MCSDGLRFTVLDQNSSCFITFTVFLGTLYCSNYYSIKSKPVTVVVVITVVNNKIGKTTNLLSGSALEQEREWKGEVRRLISILLLVPLQRRNHGNRNGGGDRDCLRVKCAETHRRGVAKQAI